MGDNIWFWAIQLLVGIIIAGMSFWLKSIYGDIRLLDKEFRDMEKTMYQNFATKSDVGKLEVKIENLSSKIENMPDRIMGKIEKLLERKP